MNLRGADLSYADMSGARLNFSILDNADLSHADMSGAELRRANLYDANLSHANLNGALIDSARLNKANLSYANVSCRSGLRADFRNADLIGARGLNTFNIDGSLWGNTRCPDGSMNLQNERHYMGQTPCLGDQAIPLA